ncbi:1,6-anhydro-N-acetylmuramyl-L-alanine amidase [hydrothermal vent metagenome]|uniref:1,6-anhydro-N-acetylmuramyl-L-alanine amidase AmpD n=1 Tax=hydrothermal vent metagenome TaxID=652676 RepID=A0A3B1B707_9ZZZZ
MHIDQHCGLLDVARQVVSPNCDARPPETRIELLVIHNISLPPGCFGGDAIDCFFTNTLDVGRDPYFAGISGMRVSAHVLIQRDGSIVQYVPFHQRAWHAGVSSFEGRSNCNDYSIGIELEGTDERAYEEVQYQALCELIKQLGQAYPAIRADGIVGHSDIAPGRKTDPGPAFDWTKISGLIL